MNTEYTGSLPIDMRAAANREILRYNEYPGRGIVMGYSRDGKQAVQVYWVEGRSLKSQNRILEQVGEEVRTQLFDPSLETGDTSLIVYTAMRTEGIAHIVSNGHQTDSIAKHIRSEMSSFEQSLQDQKYEPDGPNFTPRISGIYIPDGNPPFQISSVLANPEDTKGVEEPIRNVFSLANVPNGIGYGIHTYEKNGNPLPAFRGSPFALPLSGSIDEIAERYWMTLHENTRVALAVKGIDRRTGETQSIKIINRNVR